MAAGRALADAFAASRAHFLDRAAERATPAVLRALGVSVAPLASPGGRALPLDFSLLTEHRATSDAVYWLREGDGALFVDVRDGADAWVRLRLSPGLELRLGGGLWRRFVLDPLEGKQPQEIYERVDGEEGDGAKERRFAVASDASALRNAPAAASSEYRELLCELCRLYYKSEWMTGTGGAMSLRFGERIFVTPSGVPKERVQPDDLYVLDREGAVIAAPAPRPGTTKVPKLSDCAQLFMHAHNQRDAGAVIHSHGVTCNLVTAMCAGRDSFRISHQEMIKGLAGHGYSDELIIPIIDNRPTEAELADPIREVLSRSPDNVSAVLVRRHGLFVWGNTWEAAKRHAECLHYLFEAALEMHRLGIDYNSAASSRPQKRQRREADEINTEPARHQYVVLDIEGTTTPITFVHDVLFPFVTAHAQRFLQQTWASSSTQTDVAALRLQHAQDVANGSAPEPSALPNDDASQEQVVAALVEYVAWNVAADRKVGALKQLQGHMWNQGYESGELKAQVYADVPEFLQRMRANGVRVGIYSSGSRQAQRLLFQYSDKGDLREFLSVYFDTAIGHKREVKSYEEIKLSLGVDRGSDVLFVTDVIEEAQAAAAAGLDVALSVRPGNKPLPASHEFKTITSFDQL